MTVGLFELSRLIKTRLLRRRLGFWGWHMVGWIVLGTGWITVERVFGLPIIAFVFWGWLARKYSKSLLFLLVAWLSWGWVLAVAYAQPWWLAHLCLGLLGWISFSRQDFPAWPIWFDWLVLILAVLLFANTSLASISLVGLTYNFVVLIWVFWCDWWLRQHPRKYG